LNNMINCLLAVSGGSQWQHQLYLWTFAMACFSEDSGILLEWAPIT
jgi:hypothetical protein